MAISYFCCTNNVESLFNLVIIISCVTQNSNHNCFICSILSCQMSTALAVRHNAAFYYWNQHWGKWLHMRIRIVCWHGLSIQHCSSAVRVRCNGASVTSDSEHSVVALSCVLTPRSGHTWMCTFVLRDERGFVWHASCDAQLFTLLKHFKHKAGWLLIPEHPLQDVL